MTRNRRLFSIILTLAVLVSMLSPIVAGATGAERKGSLTIHKLYFPNKMGENLVEGTGEEINDLPKEAKPLEGAEFTIWEVEDDAELSEDGSFNTGGLELVEKKTTDSDGKVTFNGLSLGRYYVEETKPPKGVTQASAPFMVDVPSTNVAGDDHIYDVHVYPKNVLVLGAVELSKVDENGKPLSGAEFNLYSKEEGKGPKLIITETKLITGPDGKIKVEDLEVGNYYFAETKAPEGYLLDADNTVEFTISNHAYNANGEIIDGNVVKIEFENYRKPEGPEKSADKEDAGIGDRVRWTIKNTLPKNIGKYEKYTITDTLDTALNYEGNVVVKLNGTILTKETHYNLTEPATTGGGQLTIDFKASKLEPGQLEISFDTIVNSNAVVGTDIENQAILDYNNGFEKDTKESNIPKVKVGGHKFIKINKDSKGLKGAEFIVGREDGKYLIKAEGGMITWGDKDDATKFISGGDGKFQVYGLAFGQYFLEEVKAPEGYSKLQRPISFEVDANSHKTELSIENKTKPKMPQTGGMGTILFTLVGLGLMGVAAKSYKKE